MAAENERKRTGNGANADQVPWKEFAAMKAVAQEVGRQTFCDGGAAVSTSSNP